MDKLELILARVFQKIAVTEGNVKSLWNSDDMCKLLNPSGYDTMAMILKHGKGLDRSVLTVPLVAALKDFRIDFVKLLLDHGATCADNQDAINFIRDTLSTVGLYGHWRRRYQLIETMLASNEATKDFVLEHSYVADVLDEKLVFLLVGAGADIYAGKASIHARALSYKRIGGIAPRLVAAHQFSNPLLVIMLGRVDLVLASVDSVAFACDSDEDECVASVASASGGDKKQRFD